MITAHFMNSLFKNCSLCAFMTGFVFLALGCATRSGFYGPPEFQRWMRSALAHPDNSIAFHRFYLAYQGETTGLHAYFQEALRQAGSSNINVAEGEGLSFELETLVRHLGDDRFAEVLSEESRKARGAVASYFHLPGLSAYPRTQRVLMEATKIDYPENSSYERANR